MTEFGVSKAVHKRQRKKTQKAEQAEKSDKPPAKQEKAVSAFERTAQGDQSAA